MSEAFVLSETPEWRELVARVGALEETIDKGLAPRIVHLEKCRTAEKVRLMDLFERIGHLEDWRRDLRFPTASKALCELNEMAVRLDSVERTVGNLVSAGNPLTQFRDRSKELADLQEALEDAMADLMEAQKFQAQAEDSANHWRAEAKRLGQERSSVLEELSDKLEEMERWREVALLAGEFGPAAREEVSLRIEEVCEQLNPGHVSWALGKLRDLATELRGASGA